MKRFTQVLTAVALALVLATSQAFAQTNMRAGVKAGLGFATLGGDAEDLFEVSLDNKLGFSAGAFFAVDLHEMFRLQFDGQYVRKGASFTEEGVDVDINVDYLEVMVPLTLLIPTEGSVTPRLYAGPALGFETGCKLSGEEDGVSVDIDCEEVGAETKSIDFGVFLGGGIDIAVGPGALMVDALFNLGLSDINDVEGVDESIKNQNIQVLVGYAFMFGGM